MTIFTIGHSTHPIDEFIAILQTYDIKQLVDIRTIPRSGHNPQYEQTALQNSLLVAGIDYVYMKDLGGLRPKVSGSINTGWRNLSFRNYADYMQTAEFRNAIEGLISIARQKPTAIMCAEAVPWRCHRSLVGDGLVVRAVTVKDIISKTKLSLHTVTSFAKTDGITLTYPADTIGIKRE